MRKQKPALSHIERSDRNLMWFTAAVVLVVCVVLYVVPSGMDETWNGGHFEQHSQSLLARMASQF